MRYLLGIPYVNRPDLLRRAVNSVQPLWDHAFIVDNSESGEISQRRQLWPIQVLRVPRLAPLNFSQTMNYLQDTARARKCEACLFMHNDAEAHPGTAERFLDVITEAIRARRPWGAAFTNYDTLAALNMEAVREIGLWDINLPQYFSDNDYYRRLRLAGYEIIETGLGVIHHNEASSTIKSNAKRAFLNAVTFPLYAEYYRQKWGGGPGDEQFTQPFNSDLFQLPLLRGSLGQREAVIRAGRRMLRPFEVLEAACLQAEAGRSKLTAEVLAIAGMTSPKVRHLLNHLGEQCRCYLQVGCQQGATLAAACLGNQLRAVAIDNISESGGSETALLKNIKAYCPNCQWLQVDAFGQETLSHFEEPIDLFFYDGNRSSESLEKALTHFEPVFAQKLWFICDDWNWPEIREGTRRGLQKIGHKIIYGKEIFTKGNGDLESYWNGLGLFLLARKRKPSASITEARIVQ